MAHLIQDSDIAGRVVVWQQNVLESSFEVSKLAKTLTIKLRLNVDVMVCVQKSKILRESLDHRGRLPA